MRVEATNGVEELVFNHRRGVFPARCNQLAIKRKVNKHRIHTGFGLAK